MPTRAWYPVKIKSGEFVWIEQSKQERRLAMWRMINRVAVTVKRESVVKRAARYFKREA